MTDPLLDPYPTSPVTPTRETLKLATFDEQAFLIHNLRKLAELHNKRHEEETAYEKLDLLKGPNVALLNRLLNADYFRKEALLNLTPAQTSELVPQIRIFKQKYAPNQDVQEEVEFIFPAYLDTSQVLDDIGRGGYGIQSFEIESQGTTFYTADKQFTARMVLYFQSFDQFVKSRGKYSFLDLIVHPPAISGDVKSVSAPDATAKSNGRPSIISDPYLFRIRAEVGWSIGQITANSAFDKKTDAATISAIQRSKISFFLYLVDHDININEDGTLTLSINYIGAFDVIGRDVRSGIILTGEQKDALDAISKQIAAEAEKGEAGKAQIERLRGNLQLLQTTLSKDAMESIIKELMEPPGSGTRRSKVYQTVLSRAAVDQFAYFGGRLDNATSNSTTTGADPAAYGQSDPATGQTIESITPIDFCSLPWAVEEVIDGEISYPCFTPIQAPNETLTIEEFKANPIVKDAEGREYFNLSWFYLGDLLEVLMLRAFNPKTSDADTLIRKFGGEFSKRVKLILSDIEVIDYCTGDPIRLNLAHVPISLRKFTIFFYNKIVTTRNLDYTIDDFIRDMLNDLVKDVFLDRSYIANRSLKQNVNLKYINLAVYSNTPKVDLLTPSGDTVKVDSIGASKFLKSNSIGSNPNNYFFYLMIYQDTYDPSVLRGQYESDRSRGIAHIYMGRDRGIVKKVSFKKTPLPYKREERIAAQGKSFDPVLQLASLYNVDMETYGNTLFLAGTYFYLIPTGMGSGLGLPNQDRSYANIMGLGGYYFVNKITWSVESGKYITNISGIHQATGAPSSTPNKELYARGKGIGITD